MATKLSFAVVVFSLTTACGLHQIRAQSIESMQLATNLGTVIAAEEYCGLSYDQSAVAAYIEKNVSPGDVSFPSTLQTIIGGSKFQQQGMSLSAKTAHCAQIKRIAMIYKFIN